MFLTFANISATGASLRGVCRVDVFNPYSDSLSLIFHKLLKLRPCPAVQSGTHPFAGLNAFANIGQIFHHDNRAVIINRFLNNGLADFVVHMANMAGFFARDFFQKLFRAFGAVALKPPTKMQVFVAFKTEFAAAEQLAGTCGGEIVFTQINAKNTVAGNWSGVGQLKDKIKKPAFFLMDKLRFFWRSSRKILFLERANFKRDFYPALQRKKGKDGIFQRICAFVKMHGRGLAKSDFRPIGLFQFLAVGKKRFIGRGNLLDGNADHLGAKRGVFFPYRVIADMVQANVIGVPLARGETNYVIAGLQIQDLKLLKRKFLFAICYKAH